MPKMLDDDADFLGTKPKAVVEVVRKERPYTRHHHGELHEFLSEKLPNLCDEKGVGDLKKIGEALGLTYQAVLKWVKRGKVPPGQVTNLVALSQAQDVKSLSAVQRKRFVPAKVTDFHRWVF